MDTQRTPTTLDDVRLTIFRQHTQIQQLIEELADHAAAVLAGRKGEVVDALNEALELLATRFARHLEYEEAHLARWLPTGSELLGDHDDQRARIKGLLHDRHVFADRRTLAREALAFTHHLRKDMEDEDTKLRALS